MLEAMLIYFACVYVFASHVRHVRRRQEPEYIEVKPRARELEEAGRWKALDFASDVVTPEERYQAIQMTDFEREMVRRRQQIVDAMRRAWCS
jgi:hypothetical protein